MFKKYFLWTHSIVEERENNEHKAQNYGYLWVGRGEGSD
jgi:hypothetical protein